MYRHVFENDAPTRSDASAHTDFIALLRERHAHLLPHTLQSPNTANVALGAEGVSMPLIPHGTTILTIRFDGGVLIAGDRQATAGYEVADRDIQKVFELDEFSSIAIAGVAGPAVQMAKLMRTQLEFYEKVESVALSLEGKANYLAHLIRQNLPAAMQGLVIVPLLAGYDPRKKAGRLFKYDVAGGKYEESDYYSTGSGGGHARATLKKRYRAGIGRDEAVKLAVEALLDASDEDVATGGFDFVRGIYPVIKVITETGTADVSEDEIRPIADAFINDWRDDYAARRAQLSTGID